jgi:DNA polymerase-3 subunit beta
MRFICERATFAAALSRVACAINPKALLPILRCVTLRAREGQVELMATDLSLMVVTTFPAMVGEVGDVTAPFMLLQTYLKLLDDSLLTCCDAPLDQPATLTIEQGDTQAIFKGMAGDDFPARPILSPAAPAFTIQGEQLAAALRQAVAGVGGAAHRHRDWDPTASILLSLDPAPARLACLGTDRHILAYAHVDTSAMPEISLRGLLPADAAQHMSRLLLPGDCLVQWDSEGLALQAEGISCYARFSRNTAVTTYPDYHSQLAALPDLSMQVERSAFLAMVARCKGAIMAQESGKNAQVMVQFAGSTLLLRVQTADTALAMQSLKASLTSGFDRYEYITIVLPWSDLGQLVETTTGNTLRLAVSLERSILAVSDAPNKGVLLAVEVQSVVTRATALAASGSQSQPVSLSLIGSRAQVSFGSERDRAVYTPRKSRVTWPDEAALWEGSV